MKLVQMEYFIFMKGGPKTMPKQGFEPRVSRMWRFCHYTTKDDNNDNGSII